MRRLTIVPALLCLAAAAPAAAAPVWATAEEARLAELEVESHALWRRGEREALAALLADSYRFVAMNGAVERREDVVEPRRRDGPPPFELRGLTVSPDEVIVRGDAAIVLSAMEIDASVRGRPLPRRMRVMSLFVRDGEEWRLLARSITPLLAPPADGDPANR